MKNPQANLQLRSTQYFYDECRAYKPVAIVFSDFEEHLSIVAKQFNSKEVCVRYFLNVYEEHVLTVRDWVWDENS